MSSTCPSCGARLAGDSDRCDLCGTPLTAGASDDASSSQSSSSDGQTVSSLACPVCGGHNPAGSRYCNQCGSRVEGVRAVERKGSEPEAVASSAGGDRPEPGEEAAPTASSREMARRVVLTLGAGLLLMIALYGTTLMSESQSSSPPPDTSSAAAAPEEQLPAAPAPTEDQVSNGEPLPENIAREASALKDEIDEASGEERRSLQQKLIRLYTGAGRYVLAGGVQEEIARVEKTAAAWADAGNLYYDAMMQRRGQPQVRAAKQAVRAYRRSLELDPDNLDVRTDMAVAYLYDPDNPMQAIQQTNRVLEQDSMHVQANFNRGIMLMQIGRTDQAVEQFKKVVRLTEPGTQVYQQAQRALDQVQSN